MKLYRLLILALTVLAALALASITVFAEEVIVIATEPTACAEATASIGMLPVAIATLIIPSALIAIRRHRNSKK